jgi:colanic acid biosynthesis glycosyl transferase WcaI
VLASYVGHLGAMHDWQTLAGIINGLGRDEGIAVLVAATGSGAEALRSACADVTRDLVRFEAPLGDRDWRAVMARSDVAVVTLRPTAVRASSPSKAYSALAAGAAILAVMPEDTDVGTLVENEGCGRRIDPGDADAGLSVLRAWAGDRGGLEAVGAAARQAAQSRDLASLADQWIEVIDRVAPRPRVPC